MKLSIENRRGSILTVILVVIILIGITLGSYLNLVSNQNQAINRSQQWNAALPLAEAGIEEALAHLNKNVTDRSADGWKVEGTNVVRERSLGADKYRVMISKDLDPPVVVSEGYIYIPNKGKFLDHPRRVRVSTTNDALFSKALAAKGEIDINGNKLMTDSFDSSDPKYSTSGRYDSTKTKDNGDIATNSSLVNSLKVGNADIYGHVATGPDGTVGIGADGSVGSKAWHALKKTGIQPGWSADDMNVQFPDVKLPFTAGFTPTGGTNSGTNYTLILGSSQYSKDELALSGNDAVLVNGKAQLVVNGNAEIKGSAYIYIAPGASLQLYVVGSSAKLGGKGIFNSTGQAANFGYWGLNSNTEVKFTGNTSLVGTIYAPFAALELGGGGSDDYDFIGAGVAQSAKLNGHFSFHYDEALGKNGPRRGYTITSWTEVGWSEL